MKSWIGVILLVVFLACGGYYVLWAYESASFSVAAAPPMRAVYETRAILGLPLGIALAAIGILLFIGTRRGRP